MTSLCEIENQAGLCRITSGWKKPDLPIDWVRRYWRDVHSPAISRRAGLYDYRHYQYDPVQEDVLSPLEGVEYACPSMEQLMWTSDVRYRSTADLPAFDISPQGQAKADLLGDIELIVDKSTTYRTVDDNGHTFVDETGVATPQGPCASPTFTFFIRAKSDEVSFRACLKAVSETWSKKLGVVRLRLSLFDAPDMEKERLAGYPIKTHPVEQQYQACIEIALDTIARARSLITDEDGIDYAQHIKTIHAYPVRVIYTSVYSGRPTLVGLRGYPAYQAITALNADNQRQATLLEWMYGPVAEDGTAEDCL
ncbi:MAG: hypothetical protein GKS03_07850 [Alphaproteobacteria bacterium]|nr:hypothetical protein [Alphaproteobacteria bacterium]